METQVQAPGKRKNFSKELLDRFLAPWTAIFFGYLLIMVVGGGIGVLFTAYEVAQEKNASALSYKVAESLATFFVALAATSFIELNLCKELHNKKAFMTWSYILAFLSVGLLWLTYHLKNSNSFYPSAIGTLLAVMMWVIANADNDKIIKEDDFFEQMQGKGNHGNNWN